MSFLDDLRKEHEPPPSGRYKVRLIPKGLRENDELVAVTVHCTVVVDDGKLAGREIPLSFRIKAPDRQRFFVRRDVNILLEWAKAVGVNNATNGLHLLKELGRQGKDRALFMTFDVSRDPKFGPQIVITKIEVEPDNG